MTIGDITITDFTLRGTPGVLAISYLENYWKSLQFKNQDNQAIVIETLQEVMQDPDKKEDLNAIMVELQALAATVSSPEQQARLNDLEAKLQEFLIRQMASNPDLVSKINKKIQPDPESDLQSIELKREAVRNITLSLCKKDILEDLAPHEMDELIYEVVKNEKTHYRQLEEYFTYLQTSKNLTAKVEDLTYIQALSEYGQTL